MPPSANRSGQSAGKGGASRFGKSMHGLGSSKQLKSLNLSKRGLVETKKKKIKKNKKKDKARKVAHI